MAWPPCPLWDYALALYRHPGVEAACLELQRRRDVDVNLMLFSCWLGARRTRLEANDLARAKDAITAWRLEVVRPLRALRRRLKATLAEPEAGTVAALWPEQATALRRQALQLELDGEHLILLTLARGAPQRPAAGQPAWQIGCDNLASCWRFEAEDSLELAVLLQAAFPEAPLQALRRRLADAMPDPA